ncbi:hypothetical protein Tco_0628879 [Tanacetum coccineum]|uniref:Uncharacterized protein n=1 Tax=Tanacetum coccineum TaxID=301880 RepID=A0ABQ4WRI5_9ASTR
MPRWQSVCSHFDPTDEKEHQMIARIEGPRFRDQGGAWIHLPCLKLSLGRSNCIEPSSPVRYDVSNWLDTAYWRFLGVGTMFDIFQNIHVPYLQYGVLTSFGYGVLSFIPLWSLMSAGMDTPYLLDGYGVLVFRIVILKISSFKLQNAHLLLIFTMYSIITAILKLKRLSNNSLQ